MKFRTGLILLAVASAACAGCGGGSDAGEEPVAKISNPEATATSSETGTQEAAAKRPPAVDMTHPKVVLTTNLGDIVVKLDAEAAPLTVDNFLSYVDEGHYDGTIFHQVMKNYAVFAGGYTPELQEKPTKTPIRNEARQSLSNKRGTIAMLRAIDAIDSATSKFFFNLDDSNAEILDHSGGSVSEYGYCAFGEVVEGMEIIDRIAESQTVDQGDFVGMPKEPIIITSARRESATTQR